MLKGSGMSCLEKRDLLNQHAVSVESLLRWGGSHENDELFHDAIDFYEKAGAREPLKRLMEQGLEEGDVFLFKRACRALQIEPDADQWRAVGERARSLGKLLFAAEAFRHGGVEEPPPEVTSSE